VRWNRRYGLKSYARSALWIVPFVAIPIELVVSRIAHWLDPRLGWTLLGYTQQGAQALLEALVTMTLSFVVFTFASLLVAIQIAGGQLTPRIIATTLLRDDLVRYTVGLFLFTLLFALRAQDQMAGGGVHQAVIFLAAALGLLCLAAFLYLIDYAARLLRPISILRKVAGAGLTVIDSVYRSQRRHSPWLPVCGGLSVRPTGPFITTGCPKSCWRSMSACWFRRRKRPAC